MSMMKESTSTLRLFFAVVGVFYVVSMVFRIAVMKDTGLPIAPHASFVVWLMAVADVMLSAIWTVGYLYFAAALPKYLNPEKIKYIKIFLLAPFVEALLWQAWSLFTSGGFDVIGIAISALITWYLYSNISRLACPPQAPPTAASPTTP